MCDVTGCDAQHALAENAVEVRREADDDAARPEVVEEVRADVIVDAIGGDDDADGVVAPGVGRHFVVLEVVDNLRMSVSEQLSFQRECPYYRR